MKNIRPASPADLPRLLPMVHALAQHHGDTPTATDATLSRDLFSPQAWAVVLVAEGESRLQGYVALTRGVQLQAGGRTMDMHHLYVQAESRGKGLGKALVHAAVDMARAEGCLYLTVGTAPQNPDAARFYPSLGFVGYIPEGQRFWYDLSGNPA
jgi:GNAT superfamily N-acetyltransferase